MKALFAFIVVLSFLLVGCTAEKTPGIDLVISPTVDSVPLNIEAATITATTREGSTPVTGSIGVFLSGTDYTTVFNKEYYDQASIWKPRANSVFLKKGTASVCAYYPFKSTFNDYITIPLTSGVGIEDFSFTTFQNVNSMSPNNSISFTMDNAYAQLSFSFNRKNSNYVGSGVVSKIELRNLLPSATLNISNGVYSSTMGVAGKTLEVSDNVTVADGATGILWPKTIRLIPCTPASQGMELVLTVDGTTMSAIIPIDFYQPRPNEHIKMLVTISKKAKIEVASVVLTEYSYSEFFNKVIFE